jgi:hypothetical protein
MPAREGPPGQGETYEYQHGGYPHDEVAQAVVSRLEWIHETGGPKVWPLPGGWRPRTLMAAEAFVEFLDSLVRDACEELGIDLPPAWDERRRAGEYEWPGDPRR